VILEQTSLVNSGLDRDGAASVRCWRNPERESREMDQFNAEGPGLQPTQCSHDHSRGGPKPC